MSSGFRLSQKVVKTPISAFYKGRKNRSFPENRCDFSIKSANFEA